MITSEVSMEQYTKVLCTNVKGLTRSGIELMIELTKQTIGNADTPLRFLDRYSQFYCNLEAFLPPLNIADPFDPVRRKVMPLVQLIEMWETFGTNTPSEIQKAVREIGYTLQVNGVRGFRFSDRTTLMTFIYSTSEDWVEAGDKIRRSEIRRYFRTNQIDPLLVGRERRYNLEHGINALARAAGIEDVHGVPNNPNRPGYHFNENRVRTESFFLMRSFLKANLYRITGRQVKYNS